MGGICPCPCPCPKRRKDKQFAYDVHEQTFQMEEEPSQNVGQHSPQNRTQEDNNILTDQIRNPGHHEHEDHEEEPIQAETTHSFKTDEIATKSQTSENSLDKLREPQKLSEPSETQKFIEKPKQQSAKPVEEPKPSINANILNANILKPKAPKKKYNPDDYRFKSENMSFKVKKIDSIKEQQFNIDDCNNCAYFIFDITANLYIDDTNDCFIFVAPCESTIFIRNCKNVTMVAVTKQFRTYECHNCTFSLYCKSQPVVESSSMLVFTSFSAPIYPQFQQQISKKKFEVWNNHWSEIHNFTKKEGEQHYRLQEHIELEQIDWKRAFEQAELTISEEQNPIPLIMGDLPHEVQKEVLILADGNVEDTTILKVLKDAVILKAFQGVVPGQGKNQKKIILIDALEFMPEKYQELGQVFEDPQEIQTQKDKWFTKFGDSRQN